MDLMGPTKFESIDSKNYILLTVDDFSRLTWVRLLQIKDKNLEEFHEFAPIMEHNFRILTFLIFALNMALNMCSMHQKLHNKMEWLKGKIEWFKR